MRSVGEHLVYALGDCRRIGGHVGEKPLRPYARHARMRAQVRPHRACDSRPQLLFEDRAQIAHDGHDRARAALAAHIAEVVISEQHVDLHAALTMAPYPFRVELHGAKLVCFGGAPVVARVAQKHDAPYFRIGREGLVDTGQHILLLQMQIAHYQRLHRQASHSPCRFVPWALTPRTIFLVPIVGAPAADGAGASNFPEKPAHVFHVKGETRKRLTGQAASLER